MAKQTQVIIDAMTELYERGYVRVTHLDGYQAGKYSNKTAAAALRELENAEPPLLVRENEGDHTYYATEYMTEFKTGTEVMASGDEQ
jgi:hypothetical protein